LSNLTPATHNASGVVKPAFRIKIALGVHVGWGGVRNLVLERIGVNPPSNTPN
jgi:hypothetical protein